MLVIELTDDKYGKAMRNIACIEDKIAEIKSVFEEEASSGNFRKRYREDEDKYEDRDYRAYREYGKRFM